MQTFEALISTRRTLLVSPHLDDAVLSCEAFIGGQRGVDVLTVFTGRPARAGAYGWDTLCGFIDSDRAMDARLAEDARAFAGTPHTRRYLGLLDWQYLPIGRPRAPADGHRLTGWVDRWLDRDPQPALVVFPVGAGVQIPGTRPGEAARPSRPSPRDLLKHAVGPIGRRAYRTVVKVPPQESPPGAPANFDHAWVRDVLATHLRRLKIPFALYEEVPYLFGQPGDACLEQLASWLDASASEHRVQVDPIAKAQRIGAYASQLPPLIEPGQTPLDNPAGLPDSERYWLLTPTSGTSSPPSSSAPPERPNWPGAIVRKLAFRR